MIQDLLENKVGQIILSVILGLGLATLFRQVCSGNNCILIKSPDLKELDKYYYKIDSQCYKYKPYASSCDIDKK